MSENTEDLKRERVIAKVRALLNKTVENGATEAEAMAAADKAIELMNQYHLGQTDLEIQSEPLAQEDILGKFKVIRPIDYCKTGVERYCGVKMWPVWGRAPDGSFKRSHRVLGLKSDVELARWLFEMLEGAITVECRAWRHSDESGWRHLDGADKKAEVKSFEKGMAVRINARLIEKAQENEPVAMTASGTALMIVRDTRVLDAYNALGLKFGSSSGIRARRAGGYAAGQAAGNRVNFGRPIGGSNQKRIGA